MPEITTTVKAKSEYGIKTEEWGDEWANWSKPEYRGTPFDTSVQAGDRVQLTYAKADNGKVYISTIDKVTTADVPFPPDEGFPGDEAGTPFPSGPAADATESPENGSDQQDGQFRSPRDFRRTSALAQAVAYHGPDGRQDVNADREDVILTAQRFEEYLGTGK